MRLTRPVRLACCAAAMAVLTVAEPLLAAAPPPPPRRSDVERVLSESRGAGQIDTPPRPLTLVLVADRKDHGPGEHDYPRWQARWALLLGGSAASAEKAANLFGPDLPHPDVVKGAAGVRVLCAQQWPDAAQWEAADAVVVFCYISWNTERIEQVRRFLGRGGGLVIIHSATWTRPGPSADVASVVGVGGFERHRCGLLTLEVASPGHPTCLGLPPTIRLEDEPYWPPAPPVKADDVQTLVGSREQTGPDRPGERMELMFWTCQRGKGRVFGCVPGHYSRTFDHPYFRLLLLRGIAWAARESPYRFDDLALRSAWVADQ